ncbi:MAG: hypothetical protein MHPSP_001028, partial [Paramarteilia canceri]
MTTKRKLKVQLDFSTRKLAEAEANLRLLSSNSQSLAQDNNGIKTNKYNTAIIIEEEEKNFGYLNEQHLKEGNIYKTPSDKLKQQKLDSDHKLLSNRAQKLGQINEQVTDILQIATKMHEDIGQDKEKLITIESLFKDAEEEHYQAVDNINNFDNNI